MTMLISGQQERESMNDVQGDGIDVALDDIDPPLNQSRQVVDEEEDRRLAANIQQNGLLHPPVVIFDPDRKRYRQICGARRLRALKLLGKTTAAVKVIRGHLTPAQEFGLNMSENIQHSALNHIERAKGFERMKELENLNTSEVAARFNVTVSMVSRDLSLLTLSPALQTKIAAGSLPASVGAQVARIEDDETRRALVERYDLGEITRDDIAREVADLSKPKTRAGRPKRPPVKLTSLFSQDGVAGQNARPRTPKAERQKVQRLAVKLDGLSVSVAGKPDKLTIETLLLVLGRICKEAESLKDGGNADVNALANALQGS